MIADFEYQGMERINLSQWSKIGSFEDLVIENIRVGKADWGMHPALADYWGKQETLSCTVITLAADQKIALWNVPKEALSPDHFILSSEVELVGIAASAPDCMPVVESEGAVEERLIQAHLLEQIEAMRRQTMADQEMADEEWLLLCLQENALSVEILEKLVVFAEGLGGGVDDVEAAMNTYCEGWV